MTTEVSSTILDLIIVLFRGNEEEGGKNPPHVRGTDNWRCQVELRHGFWGWEQLLPADSDLMSHSAPFGWVHESLNQPPFLDCALSTLKGRDERCESKLCKHTRGPPSPSQPFPSPPCAPPPPPRDIKLGQNFFRMKVISRFQSPR